MCDRPLTIDQVLTQLKKQPEAIAALTVRLPRARLQVRASGGVWSVNDVLAHLRSCADMWGKYMAIIVAEDRPTIRAMNPTTWIKKHELSRPGIRTLVSRLYEAAGRVVGLPATPASSGLVTYRDRYGRGKATRKDGAGLRAVAR